MREEQSPANALDGSMLRVYATERLSPKCGGCSDISERLRNVVVDYFGREMPSFCIRDSNVVGFSPRI